MQTLAARGTALLLTSVTEYKLRERCGSAVKLWIPTERRTADEQGASRPKLLKPFYLSGYISAG